jgi:hypothetical protein
VPPGSIEIGFRVSLPGGSFFWTDEEPEGWTWPGARDDGRELPWLVREPAPGDSAHPDRERVVDRSSGSLYRGFLALAKRSRGTKADFGDAVVRFAARHGFLGESFALSRQLREGTAVLPVRSPEAESLAFWARQAQDFYELDSLAELLRTKDIDGLRNRIKWDGENEEVRYVHRGDFRRTRRPIATKARHPVRYEQLRSTQAFDRAWTFLSMELNRRLKDPLIVHVPSIPSRIAVAHPRTLLSALYLRLYLKAANIEWERYCEWCDTPLPRESTVRRRFCEGTQCHNKWHNRERSTKRAQRL